MTLNKILVAEDDAHIRQGLKDTLESEAYEVVEAQDGAQAIKKFNKEPFNLILLDVMMPEKSGFEVCREIRSKDTQVPIIMLTAKSEEIDKVVGLELGADDYITKPFGVHELLARINAVLRRSSRPETEEMSEKRVPESFMIGTCVIHTKAFKLEREGIKADLSEREINLLSYFYSHPGEVLSRDDILNAVWGINYLGTTRTLDQHIAQLRKKIESDPANPELIKTIHGVGYRYDPQ